MIREMMLEHLNIFDEQLQLMIKTNPSDELISIRSIREQYLKMKRYLKRFVREDDERKIKFIWHGSS